MLSRATITRPSWKPSSLHFKIRVGQQKQKKSEIAVGQAPACHCHSFLGPLSISPLSLRLAGERRNKDATIYPAAQRRPRSRQRLQPRGTAKLMHKYQDWRRTKATGGQKLMDGKAAYSRNRTVSPPSSMVHSPRLRKWWADSSSLKAANYDEPWRPPKPAHT